tara:strand:- start:584 stop:1267 length:684 start_codon:yes stop_codon:yes gene_type:complete
MINLEIIHENKNYLVINKTAGLICETNSFNNIAVEDLVHEHLVKNKKKPFIGITHRLDKVTSGVILFAKKKSILIEFNELFRNRKIQKTYWAIVKTKPPKDKEKLTNFLIKNNLEKRADIVQSKLKNAQESILTYKVIDKNELGYLLEIKPKTGRFHQIRAQLAYVGLPIIGDEKYGSDQKYIPLSICLHALKLRYQKTNSKELKSYQAKLPQNNFWKFKSLKNNDL